MPKVTRSLKECWAALGRKDDELAAEKEWSAWAIRCLCQRIYELEQKLNKRTIWQKISNCDFPGP